MSEHEPHLPPSHPPEADDTPWDVPALAAALEATPEPAADLFFGQGTAFRLGPARATHLALYPGHRAVELTTPDVVVSFRRPTETRPLQGGVLFEVRSRRTQVSLTLTPDGTASLVSEPLPAAPPSPGLVTELARFGIDIPQRLLGHAQSDAQAAAEAGEDGA